VQEQLGRQRDLLVPRPDGQAGGQGCARRVTGHAGHPARVLGPHPAQDLFGVIQARRERVLGREPVIDRHHARTCRVGHAAAQRIVRLDVADDPAAAVQVDQRETARLQRLEDPHGHPARRAPAGGRRHPLRDEPRAAAAQ